MKYSGVYFVNGTAYAGKSTLVRGLAEKYGGIACEENYHNALLPQLDKQEFPGLTYTRNPENWSDFIRRTPDEYENWIRATAKECERLELSILDELAKQGKKIFVDTNISVETLKEISDENHVLIMLADPEVSVRRFFERPDKEKQFLYQLLLKEENPDMAMENFRNCLRRINSKADYEHFLHSGFHVILQDEQRAFEETLHIASRLLKLE